MYAVMSILDSGYCLLIQMGDTCNRRISYVPQPTESVRYRDGLDYSHVVMMKCNEWTRR
jgi:hypothetical protein